MRNSVRNTAVLSLALLLLSSGAEAARRKAPKHPPLDVPIAGTVAGGGTFTGTLSLQEFVARDGQVFAIGLIRGTREQRGGPPARNVGGGTGSPSRDVSAGAARTSAADIAPQQVCQVLNLEIGAIPIDLLGLQVTTLPIGLNITAEGSGTNVIGHLICTILETVNNRLRPDRPLEVGDDQIVPVSVSTALASVSASAGLVI